MKNCSFPLPKTWLRQSLGLGLGVFLLSGTALAAESLPALSQINAPFSPQRIEISQNLPPLQSPGYGQQPGYYNTAPSYTPYAQQYSQPPLQGYVATAPAGTAVSASISQPISSEFARVGDRFSATLGSPIAAGSSILLPAGSQLEGQVVMVKSAGRTGRNGELDVRFTSAMLPNGQRVPLSARIQTDDGTGIIQGGSTKGRVGRAALKTATGAGLGAALGTAMGPLSGGEVGRGAIYGTAIGAGAGLLKSAWDKGKEALLEAGSPVNIVLDQPLTVSPTPAQGYGQPAYSQPPQYNAQPYNYGY